MQELAGRRVALYARHSKEHQAHSVPAQLVRTRSFADRHGGFVVAEYFDEAMSGAVMENRTGLQHLLRDAARRTFNAVVVEDLSRISRNQGDIARIFEALVYNEVRIVSVTEGVVNELHIGLKGTMNALFLKDVSDKARRGQYASAARGLVPGGKQYGYDPDPLATGDGRVTTGHRKINPKIAATVRSIFEDVDAGTPLRAVADSLNRRGIPSPEGGLWTASTLAGTRWRGDGLLRKAIYKGKIVFGKTITVRNPKTGQRQRRPRPRSEWLEHDAPHLAIVSPELFGPGPDAPRRSAHARRSGETPAEAVRRAALRHVRAHLVRRLRRARDDRGPTVSVLQRLQGTQDLHAALSDAPPRRRGARPQARVRILREVRHRGGACGASPGTRAQIEGRRGRAGDRGSGPDPRARGGPQAH